MRPDDIISILREYKKKNQAKYRIVNIGIFGSSARGPVDERSDVDIVVELEEPDMFHLIGIKQDLEEELNRPVDIVRYREKMNAFLKRRIEREAVYA
jgi:predicted nucleotidyltransferase